MSKEYNVLIEKGVDGYYVGSVIELPGCHTQGRSIDELLDRMKEAIEVYLEAIPSEERESEFVGIQRMHV